MLNRRQAIAAGTAAVLAGPSLPNALAQQAPKSETHAAPHAVDSAAAACRKCEAACRELLTAAHWICRPRTDLKTQVVRTAEDTADLCKVAAQLLSRRGPLAPAICQACADACDRLIRLFRQLPDSSDVESCLTTGTECRAACVSLVASA